MDSKKQYLNEISQQKQERIKRIIEVAKKEFASEGITNTKISTIAKGAQVGEATVYRYFSDKIQLIKVVANDYWHEQTETFKTYLSENIDNDSNGISKIEVYLGMFIQFFHYHKDFLKFMEDFDNYHILSRKAEKENEFFIYIYLLRKIFNTYFDEGVSDGSIDPGADKATAFSFISQVMVSTTQKMALRLGYSHSDNSNYAVKCLESTIDMFLQYISNKKAK